MCKYFALTMAAAVDVSGDGGGGGGGTGNEDGGGGDRGWQNRKCPVDCTCDACWMICPDCGQPIHNCICDVSEQPDPIPIDPLCKHGKVKSTCTTCARYCPHGRQKHTCRECGGTIYCTHGKRRYTCKECRGSGLCIHLIEKFRCRMCGGSGFCVHGRQKAACRQCKEAKQALGVELQHEGIDQLPEFDTVQCRDCGFSFDLCTCDFSGLFDDVIPESLRCKLHKPKCAGCKRTTCICVPEFTDELEGIVASGMETLQEPVPIVPPQKIGSHVPLLRTKRKIDPIVDVNGLLKGVLNVDPDALCKTCKFIVCRCCEHGRRKFNCRPCGGSSFCSHGRQKSRCRDCGGSSFCPHGRQKFRCKECGTKDP